MPIQLYRERGKERREMENQAQKTQCKLKLLKN